MKLFTALTLLLSQQQYNAAFRTTSFGIKRLSTSSSNPHRGAPLVAFARATGAGESTCPTTTNSIKKNNKLNQHPSVLTINNAATKMLQSRGGSSTSAASTTSTVLNSAVQTEAAEGTETKKPVEIYRRDYESPANWVTHVDMDFDISDGKTVVTSLLTVEPNPDSALESKDLILDGDETSVSLHQLSVDGGGDLVEGEDYVVEPGRLVVRASALKRPKCVVRTVASIVPEDNTQLSGLYKSGPMYCSQCEAMGFRRITYYPDRPDNMATFGRVRIEADRASYPVLLSNGNLIESGAVEGSDGGDRHYSVWSDPFPKPSYLFCVVAGNLGSIEDTYTTASGRKVHLEIYSERENVKKLDYAMESLKNSMDWDEKKYGLEYDLDLYNIVAVNDFNMGAMENKGLNVFNTAYVLADPASATDADYERVEGVIGHEYFHNWTGNRVTCRDWFQLTLKEGLTVFRDQEFSGDMGSNAVKRIETVKGLRGRQFNEDAGPMSHPIRPESYISMDNFYTATVYSKGAEVIRMYNTLLTPAGFRKGMDLYFERHDGSAVTCDDFRAAMADANSVDLSQFERWYTTPGTPTVTYSSSYDADEGVFSLTLSQQSNSAEPLHIPVSTGLLDKATGKEVVPTKVLELREKEQTFEFPGLKGVVVPSILRDFSAPVKLVSASGTDDEEALAFLAAHDTDGFNKWEAGQKLFTSLILETMRGEDTPKTEEFVNEAFGRTLADDTIDDYSIKAYALTLPSEAGLAEELPVVDPVALRKARKDVKKGIARKFQDEIQELYDDLTDKMEADGKEFRVDATSVGRRRLRNVLLEYLCSVGDTDEEKERAAALAKAHYSAASGLTDKLAALQSLASMDGVAAEARDEAVKEFYEYAKDDALVLDKWFTIQAFADLPDVLDRVKSLARCRALMSAFTMNAAPFHDESGEGYKFVGETIGKLDKINPQVSSRMANSLIQWRRYDEKRAALMKAELEKLANMKPISDDLFEIVSRGLK